MNRDRRLDAYAGALKFDLISITEARVALGTASRREVLGYRWPMLFRKFAAENARHDAQSRKINAKVQATIARLRDGL